MARNELRKLSPEDLMKVRVNEEYLNEDYQRLKNYKGKFIGCAALAWCYQKGRLREHEFRFLYYWKSLHSPCNPMSDAQGSFRMGLVKPYCLFKIDESR